MTTTRIIKTFGSLIRFIGGTALTLIAFRAAGEHLISLFYINQLCYTT